MPCSIGLGTFVSAAKQGAQIHVLLFFHMVETATHLSHNMQAILASYPNQLLLLQHQARSSSGAFYSSTETLSPHHLFNLALNQARQLTCSRLIKNIISRYCLMALMFLVASSMPQLSRSPQARVHKNRRLE